MAAALSLSVAEYVNKHGANQETTARTMLLLQPDWEHDLLHAGCVRVSSTQDAGASTAKISSTCQTNLILCVCVCATWQTFQASKHTHTLPFSLDRATSKLLNWLQSCSRCANFTWYSFTPALTFICFFFKEFHTRLCDSCHLCTFPPFVRYLILISPHLTCLTAGDALVVSNVLCFAV